MFNRRKFIENVATLGGGNALSICVTIFTAPIISRIYPPEMYFVLAVCLALNSIFVPLSSLQYNLLIIKQKSQYRESFLYSLILSIFVALSIVILIFAMVWIFDGLSFSVLEWSLIGLSIVLGSTIVPFESLLNKEQKYRSLSLLKLCSTVLVVLVSIYLGLNTQNRVGLLFGLVSGQALMLVVHSFMFFQQNLPKQRLSIPGAKEFLVEGRKYAFFTTPNTVLNSVTMQAPIIVLTSMAAASLTGAFSRARDLASLPVSVLGVAAAMVFRQEISDAVNENRQTKHPTRTVILLTGIVGCAIYIPLYFVAPWLFEVYLGTNWRVAGEVVSLLSPMLLLRMMASPLAGYFQMTNREGLALILNALYLVIVMSAIGAAAVYSIMPWHVIVAFSASQSIVYIVHIAVILYLTNSNIERQCA